MTKCHDILSGANIFLALTDKRSHANDFRPELAGLGVVKEKGRENDEQEGLGCMS